MTGLRVTIPLFVLSVVVCGSPRTDRGTSRAHAEADAHNSPDFKVTHGHKAMGTVVNITFWTDDEVKAAKAAQAVFKEFDRVDELMTSWGDESAVSRINAAAGKKAVRVDDEVFGVIQKALAMSRTSGGAFDITVGAFRGLWKFDQDKDGSLPDDDEVAAKKKLVNYRWVQVNRKAKTVKLKKAGMRITLGGIAKGYAVDRGVKLLHDLGFADFILQAGGDLYVSGQRGSRSWVVGIRDPRGARNAVFAIAPIKDHTFSTSGDYERAVVKDGKRYHHILDPDTGAPAIASRSVTVMANDAQTADAWSTTLFIMGADKGMKLVEKTADIEAVFVDSDNNVHISSGLQKVVRLRKKPSDGV